MAIIIDRCELSQGVVNNLLLTLKMSNEEHLQNYLNKLLIQNGNLCIVEDYPVNVVCDNSLRCSVIPVKNEYYIGSNSNGYIKKLLKLYP